MEGYRSYPEERPDYSEGLTSQPEYAENSQGWYADWGQREPERYDEPRRDPLRSAPGPAPGLAPGPTSGGAPGPLPGPAGVPGSPGEPARAAVPPPGATPTDDLRAARRPAAAPGSPGPAGDSVYRSRRPGVAALFGVPAVLLELPALFLLTDAMFGDPASPSGVVGAVCLILALPLAAVGLYAVATGAVRAAGPNSAQAWLRPPVAYLSVALVLFLAAGLAA